MIDIHQHIVYGIDDGAESADMTFNMLSLAAEQGIKEIVCTPHISPGYSRFDMDRYLQHIEIMRKYLDNKQIDIILSCGAEIMYTHETLMMLSKGLIPTLGNSRSVLVEFLPETTIDVIMDAVLSLNCAGYVVVIAHAERYKALHDSLETVKMLKRESFVYIQVNAYSILNINKLFCDPWLKRLLKEELVDIVASDAHNTNSRVCKMSEAYNIVKMKYGIDFAERIFRKNAGLILHDN